MIKAPKASSLPGNNLLMHAISHGDTKDVLGLLEDKEADVNFSNVNGCTPLHFAVLYQNKDIVEILLKYNADPNVKDGFDVGSSTPIHRAVEKNNFEICKLLIQYGANPSLQDKNGFTALHIACKNGYKEIVKLLIDSGVDVHLRDELGYNASYWAEMGKYPDILKMLPKPAKITVDEYYKMFKQAKEDHEIPEKKGKKRKGGKKKK